MELNIKFIVFYSLYEINIKDIEKDLYTKDRKMFHLFFFHNKNLHFKKSKIFNECLIKEFENIEPEFDYDEKKATMIMNKKIKGFNKKEFNKKVTDNYNQYINLINYRIECIFQTFTLFNNLYKDKSLIFAFPYQLYKKFVSLLENNRLNFETLLKKNIPYYTNYFDIVYWINYFLKIDNISNSDKEFKNDNIKKVIKII